ncbi:MAG TPA: ABC transporter ATP-binding protein [Tissierellia bacterium]|nr:ABC transporter ATP-binding protein [Tissierellia bacterium]
MIHIDSLKVFYGDHLALNIQQPLSIDRGDRIGVIGANGAGKTTLLHALLGIVPSKGQVRMDVAREEIAVHLQFNEYITTTSVRYLMEAVLGTRIERHPTVMALIEFFNFKDSLKKRFNQLSGGQKQRLTLILVIAQNSPLVFFDEVTSGLDFESRQRLVELIGEHYKDKDSTLCFITHYYEELENFAEKLLLLHEGEVVDFGEKEALFHKYCGRTIFVIDRSEQNEAIVQNFRQIEAPSYRMALSAQDEEQEKQIAQTLIEHNINYKRTSSDIEIMSVNALKRWEKERSER